MGAMVAPEVAQPQCLGTCDSALRRSPPGALRQGVGAFAERAGHRTITRKFEVRVAATYINFVLSSERYRSPKSTNAAS